MNTAQNILKDLVGELKSLAKTETVVGAPVTAGQFTLIPISRVSLGVGAGGGAGETLKKSSTGEGGGGGGGIRVAPVAVVAIRGDQLSVHMLVRGASVGAAIQKMPDVLEGLLDRWQARKEKEEAKESS
jgi:uncharacterized spore protein YtfJ